MNFTEEMMIVMQAIWELREGPRVGLNRLKLERHISKIIGDSRKPIGRQNWYNNKAKPEWKAIRRAIDGLEPLDGHEDVEMAIASFGSADKQRILVARIAQLQADLDVCRIKIEKHETTFEEFKLKAYSDQYVVGRFWEEYEHYKQQYENYVEQATKDEKLRKQLDAELSKLRAENMDLTRLALTSNGALGYSKSGGKHKLFIPDIGVISNQGSDADLIESYRAIKTESFQAMLKEAVRKTPDEIFIIFHRFNTNLPTYIKTELPISQERLTYVFACYEPISEKRNVIYSNAANKSTLIPKVFIVIGEQSTSNVIQLQATQEVDVRLREKAKTSIFRPYDFDVEQYEQVYIKRV